MTMLNSGNVGINETTPEVKLEIVGAGRFTSEGAASNATTGKGMELQYATSGRGQGEGSYIISYDRSNSAYKPLNLDASAFTFNTGNVSLGTPAPTTHAKLNIGGSQGGTNTLHRAIDIEGSWAGGEAHAITYNHSSGGANMVAQVVAQHDSPGSRFRWGKFYHGGDSTTFTMELVSTSLTTADLTVAGAINSGGDITNNSGVYWTNKHSTNLRFGATSAASAGIYMASVTGTHTGELMQILNTSGNALTIANDGSATFGKSLTAGADLHITGNVVCGANMVIGSHYLTDCVRSIQMGHGGQIEFGDIGTTNPLGISEGYWDTFTDTDNLTIYCRQKLDIRGYNADASVGTELYATFDNEQVTFPGDIYLDSVATQLSTNGVKGMLRIYGGSGTGSYMEIGGQNNNSWGYICSTGNTSGMYICSDSTIQLDINGHNFGGYDDGEVDLGYSGHRFRDLNLAGDATFANGNAIRWTSDDVRIEGTTASDNIKFYCGNSERFKIAQTGGATFADDVNFVDSATKINRSGVNDLHIWSNSVNVVTVSNTIFRPSVDNTTDCGHSSYRWKNLYVADMQLSNENTGGNDVDGTEGSWTIQEGEDDLFLLNRKNGKKYKFKLEVV